MRSLKKFKREINRTLWNKKKCRRKTLISPFKLFPPRLARSTQSKSVFNCEGVAALLIARFAWIKNYSVAHWNLCRVNVFFFSVAFSEAKKEKIEKKKKSLALCECVLVYLCGDTCSSDYDFVAPYVTSFNFRSQFNATFAVVCVLGIEGVWWLDIYFICSIAYGITSVLFPCLLTR